MQNVNNSGGVISLSCVTCLCSWPEIQLFQTIQVHNKSFPSVITTFLLVYAFILLLLTMCLTIVNNNISSNMTVTPVGIVTGMTNSGENSGILE